MEMRHRPLLAAVGVAVAVLMIAGLAFLSARPAPDERQVQEAASAPPTTPAASPVPAVSEPPAPQPVPEEERDPALESFLLGLARRDPDDTTAVGPVDAPVVMIEWADFRCPYCSAFAEVTLPQLRHHFDEGTVRYEFRDLALFGEESVYAAVAARAAGEQGKHHEFMSVLYAALPNDGHPVVDEDVVTEVAMQIGVPDMAKFDADLESLELRNAVLTDTNEARSMGLSSVPVFVVGTQIIQGAQPPQVFEQVIQQELAKASTR